MEIVRSGWRGLRARDPFLKDALLAGGLGVLAVLESLPQGGLTGVEPTPPAAWPLLAGAVIAPLAWRRSRPLAMVGVQAAAMTVAAKVSGHLAFSLVQLAAYLFGCYSAGAYSRSRGWSLTLVLIGGIAPAAVRISFPLGDFPYLNAIIPLTAWLIGHAVRAQRQLVAGLRERALRLEREREATTRAALAEERARIARELHDVVAHGVSVMVVQAEAARRMLRRHPDQAEEALRSVSATGSAALTELQHMLGVLTGDSNPAELEPAPGMKDLDALVERVQAAGLRVELHLDGDPRAMPRGLDLTAYRIVQEALTNVLKHAQTSRAEVRLLYSEDSLGIDVVDAGRAPVRSNGAGRGLVGMRERVAAYGGELRTGPRPGGGYEVHVRLPLEVAR